MSLLFGDAIQNTPKSVLNLPLRWAGFGGGPKVVPVFKLLFVADKARMKEHLAILSELSSLTRVVPAHGDIVENGAAAALKSAAQNA